MTKPEIPAIPADAIGFYTDRRFCIERLHAICDHRGAVGQAMAVGVIQCLLHKPPAAWAAAGAARQKMEVPLRAPSARHWLVAAGMLLGGLLFQLLVVYRTGRRKAASRELPEKVFVSVVRAHNGNRHILEYLRKASAGEKAVFVDVDTGFFRSAASRIEDGLCRVMETVPPFSWVTFWAGARNLAPYIPPLARLIAEVGTWTGCPDSRKRFFHVARNLVRGECLAAFWKKAGRLPRYVIFGNLNTDCVASDALLREQGVETTHWLHGTVEDEYKYFAYSSVCLAPTAADASVRKHYGAYRKCGFLRDERSCLSVVDAPSVPGGEVLLLTNLLHAGHQLPEDFRRASLRRLLQAVGDGVFGEMKSTIWFPHPMEVGSRVFPELVNEAEKRGVLIGESGGWRSRVGDAALVITTFSGSVLDMLQLGRVPVVWSDVRYPRVGLWERLPQELLFSDEKSLRSAIEAGKRLSASQLLSTLRDSTDIPSFTDPWHASIRP